MEVKISLSDGFETVVKRAESNNNFVSMYITNNELNNSTPIRLSRAFIIDTSLSSANNIQRGAYITAHSLACCYKSFYQGMISGAIKGSIKTSAINITNNGSNILDIKVDAQNNKDGKEDDNIFDFMFFCNEKLILPENMENGSNRKNVDPLNIGLVIDGYMCLDFFERSAEVSAVLNTVEHEQNNDLGIFLKNNDNVKIYNKLQLFMQMMMQLKKAVINNSDKFNAKVRRIKDLIGFGVVDDGKEIILLMRGNTSGIMENDLDEYLEKININDMILFDREKFYSDYIDFIEDDILNYGEASKLEEDSIECIRMTEVDLVLFEIIMTCFDMCYTKKSNQFVVLDVDRYLKAAGTEGASHENMDNELAIILPMFNDFVKHVSDNTGTVIYLGVVENSKTHKVLKMYNQVNKIEMYNE